MKRKFVLLTVLSMLSSISKSQPILFGTNQVGNGNIIRYDVSRNELKPVYTFPNDGLIYVGPSLFNNVSHLLSELTRGVDGLYYGVTLRGGKTGGGVIFQVDPVERTYNVVHNFSAETGEYPTGKLLASSDGKLYGVASGKSVNDSPNKDRDDLGVIFSFDPVTQQYALLWDLGNFGHIPIGGLAEADNGKLYGIVRGNVLPHTWNIVSFDVSSNNYSIEYLFKNTTGTTPGAGMMKASDGKLYGLTGAGGLLQSYGVLYSFDPNSKIYSVEKYFNETDGSSPSGGLSREFNGRFYGTTRIGPSGGGIIFSYSITSKQYSKLYSLEEDLEYPDHGFSADLAIGHDGTLYGMDQIGLYSYNVPSGVFKYLEQQKDASGPGVDPLFIVNDTGVLALQTGSAEYFLVKRLNAPNGLAPTDNLVQGYDGKLYGSTTQGGQYDRGGLFSFDPVSKSFQKLADFDFDVPGIISPLVALATPAIYFITTDRTVEYGNGTKLIHYDVLSNSFAIDHQFEPDGDGLAARSVLVKGPDGNIYGTTVEGGSFGRGVIYRFSPSINLYEKLHDFGSLDPTSKSLTIAIDGKIYGFFEGDTDLSMNNFYSLDPARNAFTNYPYSKAEFGNEISDLPAMDSSGKIYAFTSVGENNQGNVFRFNPTTKGFDKVLDLNDNTGTPMLDPMLIAKDGILYGSTVFRDLPGEPNQPLVNQLISVNTITKEFVPLTFMQESTVFKPTVLYELETPDDFPIVTITDTSVYESDGKASVRIHLSKPLEYTLRLYYQTLNGTAASGNPDKDYNRSNGHFDFKKGTTDKIVRINIRKDKVSEPDEYFYVKLINANSEADAVKFTHDQAMVTIKDGIRPVNVVSVAAATVSSQRPAAGKNVMINQTFSVNVSPNPSSTSFRLVVNSNNLASAEVTVLDAMGRIASKYSAVLIGIPVVIGENLSPGIYIVEVQQGKERRTIKLIKQP
jgi:uncharacterized repeat protein (TIGR03803 family)